MYPIPSNWRLRAPVRPAVWRGLGAAIPVGLGLLLDLELDAPAAGGIAAGAFMAGFVAFDAPGRTRFVWQVLCAPLIGAAAALGALTSEPAALAAATMTVFATVAGLSVAVSRRLSIAGMTCVLALLVAQGLSLDAHEALDALLLGGAGAALQALLSLSAGRGAVGADDVHPIAGVREVAAVVRANLTMRSASLRHALRWGVALGVAVALYHVVDLGQHGFWIPLTVLFVLKPSPGETQERIVMRAAGTVAGLAIATPLTLLTDGHDLANAAVIAVAAGFSFALLAIEYALFTTAITTFVVVLAHALGEPAVEAADERAIATSLGIAIAALSFAVWSERRAGPPDRSAPL